MDLSTYSDAELAHAEICTCGHARTVHLDKDGRRGAGACMHQRCKCPGFQMARRDLQKLPRRDLPQRKQGGRGMDRAPRKKKGGGA